ncbi:MAG: SGNH/GDSL hydrolase family protein [Thermoguttaceae bacterium]|jgi:lysophospholipase L1-like esterase
MCISPATAELLLRQGDFVAIAGDSITEQRLYSVFIEDYLLMCQPEADLRACQFGWKEETSYQFAGRLANDVFRFRPNVVTTCFGTNNGPFGPTAPEEPQSYREAQRSAIKQMKKAGVRVIVVGSPTSLDVERAFGGDRPRALIYNRALARLRDIAREVAAEQGVPFADLHDAMIEFVAKAKAKYGKDYWLCGDGGHPDRSGHLVMAYVFLKALGCDGNLGTISVDLAADKARATHGHKVLSCAGGRIEIESTRYPFCFYGDPARFESTRGVPQFIPFNEELNRFRLVVSGLGQAKAKVTWGGSSREFPAARLAQGINLAAAFLDNPFSEPFRKLEERIASKQWGEMSRVKEQMHSLGVLREYAPQEQEALERLAAALVKQCQIDRQMPAKEMVPVRHVLKIEPVQ